MAKCKTNPTAKQRRTMRGSNFALPWSKASALYRRKHKDEDPTRSGKSKAFSGGYPMNCGKKQAVNARQFATKAWKDGNLTLADLKLIYKKTEKWGLGPFQDVTCSGRGQKRTCHTKTGAANKGRRSRGRRAGKRWYTHSAGVNQFGTQMWTVTYGDREVADISKSRGEKHFDVVMVSGPNRGAEEWSSSLADAKKLVKHLSGAEFGVHSLGEGARGRGRRAGVKIGYAYPGPKPPAGWRKQMEGTFVKDNPDGSFDTVTYYWLNSDWRRMTNRVGQDPVDHGFFATFQEAIEARKGRSARGRRASWEDNLISVSPNMDYSLLGTGIKLNKNKTYFAIPATNQPGWKEKGLVFLLTDHKGNPAKKSDLEHAASFLLERGDYTAVGGRSSRGRRAVDEHAARELELYIDNDYQLYRQKTEIRKNQLRKVKSGKYNPALAPKLWMYLVDAGAKKYNKAFGSPGVPWHKVFPKETRMHVAQEYAKEFDSELRSAGSWQALADEYGVLGEWGLKNRGRRAWGW